MRIEAAESPLTPGVGEGQREGVHGMKRRIIKTCVLLLAGAIINVAVAWGGQLADDKRWSIMDPDECRTAWISFAPNSWVLPAKPFGIQFNHWLWTAQQVDEI